MLDGSFSELMGQEGQADYGRERLWKHNSQQSGAAGRNRSREQVAFSPPPCLLKVGGCLLPGDWGCRAQVTKDALGLL